MVSPAWHNYRYHQNRPPSQENPKFNFLENYLSRPELSLKDGFWGPGHLFWTLTEHFVKPLVIST
jgi:hypothetical protein